MRPISLLFLLASAATAQDFYWGAVSPRSLGQAGIYSPSGDQVVDALAVNPAGLALLASRTIDLSISALFPRGEFSNAVNDHAKLNTGPRAIPTAGFGMPIGKRWSVGAGVMPEIASDGDWLYADAPGTGGANYGVQRNRSGILALRTAAGFGVSLGSRVQVGGTVGLVYNSNQWQALYTFQTHPALRGLKTNLDLQTSGTGWNGSIGILARVARGVRVGAAWKSRTLIHSTGRAVGTLDAQFAALGIAAPPAYRYLAAVKNEFAAIFPCERRVARPTELGAQPAGRLGELEVRLPLAPRHAY